MKYKDEAGKDQKIRISTSNEYYLKLKSGTEMYATFSALKTEKTPNGKSTLIPAVIMTPGYMNVMREGQTEIDTNDIVEIYQVDSKYIRSKRSVKSIEVDKNSSRFSFAFDTKKFETQYKITIYCGEFVSLVYHPEDEDKSRTIYGEITDVDGDEIVFTQYRAKGGIRSIVSNIRVPSEQTIGIYRYELGFEPHVDKKNDDGDKEAEPVFTESKSE